MIKAIFLVALLSLAASAPYDCINEAGELVWSIRRLAVTIQ